MCRLTLTSDEILATCCLWRLKTNCLKLLLSLLPYSSMSVVRCQSIRSLGYILYNTIVWGEKWALLPEMELHDVSVSAPVIQFSFGPWPLNFELRWPSLTSCHPFSLFGVVVTRTPLPNSGNTFFYSSHFFIFINNFNVIRKIYRTQMLTKMFWMVENEERLFSMAKIVACLLLFS